CADGAEAEALLPGFPPAQRRLHVSPSPRDHRLPRAAVRQPAHPPGPANHVSSSSSTSGLSHPRVRRGDRGAYRLVRTPPARVNPPRLDADQRSAVEHGTGPLLVLAGPGTGKTTTLVESVAARVARGTDPERMLLLPCSRKAAVGLRGRMALRMGAASAPLATTFHSYCYALVRAPQDQGLFVEPLRLLSGPEQDVTVRELLAGQVD